jgi:hypothetical protein
MRNYTATYFIVEMDYPVFFLRLLDVNHYLRSSKAAAEAFL